MLVLSDSSLTDPSIFSEITRIIHLFFAVVPFFAVGTLIAILFIIRDPGAQPERKKESLIQYDFDAVVDRSQNYAAKGEEGKAQDMLQALFEYFQTHPDELPDDFQSIRAEEGVDRAVCDYIAGMTDPFAVEQFTRRFIPAGWSMK